MRSAAVSFVAFGPLVADQATFPKGHCPGRNACLGHPGGADSGDVPSTSE